MPDDLKGAVETLRTVLGKPAELIQWREEDRSALCLALAHLSRLQEENERLRSALETFAIMANDETAYLPDEHIITLSYDDSELDDDLGGPNTLLGERFMRAFRQAAAALSSHEEGGAENGDR